MDKNNNPLNIELSVEQALLLDDEKGSFLNALMETINKSIEYYDHFIKAHHSPEEFEQATVLLKSFQSAKNVASKMTKKMKREKTSFLQ